MTDDQALDIAALIERSARLFMADAHAEGLLPVHWEVLRYLNLANQFSRTHAALTGYLGLTKGTVSQTLKALDGKGLIHKETDKTDRRSRRLVLTARGRRLLERDPVRAWIDEIAGLQADDRDGLARGLAALLSARLDARERAPFGQCRTCMYFREEHEQGAPHYCDLLKAQLSREAAHLICAEQRLA